MTRIASLVAEQVDGKPKSPRVPARLGVRLAQLAEDHSKGLLATINEHARLSELDLKVLLSMEPFFITTVENVAQRSRCEASNVKTALGRLKRKNLVREIPDDFDARRHLLTITESGIALHRKATKAFAARDREVFSVLSYKERVTLSTLINKVVAALPLNQAHSGGGSAQVIAGSCAATRRSRPSR